MVIKRFEDIESWKKARLLVKEIHEITQRNNFKKDFSLKDQIKRASVSIMSNVAEGFDSGSNRSFIKYLNISLGSSSEVKSILYVALDQEYISEDIFEELYQQCEEIKKLIKGFKKYLNTSKENNYRDNI
jgi:four helix bundle protein